MSIQNRPVVYKGTKLEKECASKGIEYPVKGEIPQFESSYSDTESLVEDFKVLVGMSTPDKIAKSLNGKLKIDYRSSVLATVGIVTETGGKTALEQAIMAYATSHAETLPRFVKAASSRSMAGYYDSVMSDARAFLDTDTLTAQELEKALPSILTD